MQEEKLQRHKAKLDQIQNRGEERHAKIAEHNKAWRQVHETKPLHLVYQERQAQLESDELAKAKKLLEEKRNFKSKDAGSFKKALSEHESKIKAIKKEVN